MDMPVFLVHMLDHGYELIAERILEPADIEFNPSLIFFASSPVIYDLLRQQWTRRRCRQQSMSIFSRTWLGVTP